MAATIVIIVLILLRVVPAVVAGVAAKKKNRNVIVWVLFGLVFPLPTMVVALLVGPIVPCKRCTQCQRLSRVTTQMCPYCNIPMPEGPIVQGPDPASGSSMAMIVLAVVAVALVGVAIIGILAAIAIPQFASLTVKSREGATKGNLGSIRSGLSIYYGDTNGRYPPTLAELTVGQKYLQSIPVAYTPRTPNSKGHPDSSKVASGSAATGLTDEGGWLYDNKPGPTFGQVVVNCSHKDLRGNAWTTY